MDRVVEVADGADAAGADACPLPYDAGAAAKAAKLDGDLRPGAAGAGRTSLPRPPRAGGRRTRGRPGRASRGR